MARLVDHLLFCSRGRIGVVDLEGRNEYYLDLRVSKQEVWQPGPVFSDGRRILLWSQEAPKDPKADFGTNDSIAFATTHLWVHYLGTCRLDEIELPSLMTVVALMPGEERILVSGNMKGKMRLLTTDLEGGDQDLIEVQEGYGYGTSLSPDGSKAAYHIVGTPNRNPYEIYAIDIETKERTLVASHPDYLNFGTQWSPDGEWILYQMCAHKTDPGHERSDICMGRADGTAQKLLTEGQSHWFATSYGSPETRGGGSNMPRWSPDGASITFTRALPGSRTAWHYRADRPDRDHFNRDYAPGQASGGTEICVIRPESGEITVLMTYEPLTWNWRTEWSPNSRRISFSRAAVSRPSEVWIMDSDGSGSRMLTRGVNDLGADFARFARLLV